MYRSVSLGMSISHICSVSMSLISQRRWKNWKKRVGNPTEGVALSDDATTEWCLLQIFHFPQNYPAPGMNNPRISIPQGGFKGLAACDIIGKDVQEEAMYGVNLYSGTLVQKDHLRYCGKYPRMGQQLQVIMKMTKPSPLKMTAFFS